MVRSTPMDWRNRAGKAGQYARVHLPVFFNLLVIVLLIVLDVRDLAYKISWIGPADSYSFQSGSSSYLDPAALVPTIRPHNASSPAASSKPVAAASGWVSFLSRCEQIHPFRSSDGFFLSAKASNCQVDETTFWPQVVFTSDMRVDAMVWAACHLLPVSTRPPICYEEIAVGFLNRYNFHYPALDSAASLKTLQQQQQLLRFLAMVSKSMKYAERIVCVEITRFEFNKWLTPFAFGCASANVYQSEFIYLDEFFDLQYDKGWVTWDVLQLWALQFGIRQNVQNRYIITGQINLSSSSLDSSTLHLKSESQVNFSSFGHLYALLLAIDIYLMLLNLESSIEILHRFISPEYYILLERVRNSTVGRSIGRAVSVFRASVMVLLRATIAAAAPVVPSETLPKHSSATGRAPFVPQELQVRGRVKPKHKVSLSYSFYSASLYRSGTICILTMISQGLSWFIVLPNSVVWTWSESAGQIIRAYQTSIRVWVLLLLLAQLLWDVCVKLNEKLAYRIVKRTYLTHVEVVLTVMLVSVLLRRHIFAICELKWNSEHQRVNDVTTFPSYIAHGNTFAPEMYFRAHTPKEVLWIIYKPLVLLLTTGMAVCFAVAALKYCYNLYTEMWQEREHDRGTSMGSIGRSVRTLFPTVKNLATLEKYHRLPMEIMLDSPIRARSLIRNSLLVETIRNGELDIHPSCFADYGVLVSDGFYRTRVSFAGRLQPVLHRKNLPKLVAGKRKSSVKEAVHMDLTDEEDPDKIIAELRVAANVGTSPPKEAQVTVEMNERASMSAHCEETVDANEGPPVEEKEMAPNELREDVNKEYLEALSADRGLEETPKRQRKECDGRQRKERNVSHSGEHHSSRHKRPHSNRSERDAGEDSKQDREGKRREDPGKPDDGECNKSRRARHASHHHKRLHSNRSESEVSDQREFTEVADAASGNERRPSLQGIEVHHKTRLEDTAQSKEEEEEEEERCTEDQRGEQERALEAQKEPNEQLIAPPEVEMLQKVVAQVVSIPLSVPSIDPAVAIQEAPGAATILVGISLPDQQDPRDAFYQQDERRPVGEEATSQRVPKAEEKRITPKAHQHRAGDEAGPTPAEVSGPSPHDTAT